jgi:Flp pilus assembly pilin Flp
MSILTPLRTAAAKRRALKQSDKGAEFIEYGAVILLVAAIAAAVLALGIGDTIVNWIESALNSIAGDSGVEITDTPASADPSPN